MSSTISARSQLLSAILLAFTAGFVDVAGFVALFSLFTAHVTGNFVLIGAAIAGQGAGGLLAKMLALPVFVVAVAITRLLANWLEQRNRPALAPLLTLELLLLLAMLALGLMARPIINADAPLVITAGMAGVAAMGVQNCVSRVCLATLPPTTIMTGNTTQAVIDLVDVLRGEEGKAAAADSRLRRVLPVMLSFALGTSVGALSLAWLSFWCLGAPLLALALLVAISPWRSP